MTKIRIATRKSKLALWQTRWVAARLEEHAKESNLALEIEEVHVITEGDRIVEGPLSAHGGKGLFVREVEMALLEGRADIAVHSLKDLPGDRELAPELTVACTPVREDPRDVLLTTGGEDIDSLRAGSSIGTTSLRRISQLRTRRPDLAFVNLRGNVDTRIRRLEEGKFVGIVLATAGLKRLGLLNRPHWIIPTDICLPAVGQGTLAIQARKEDASLIQLLSALEHHGTRMETEAERGMLSELQGSCHVPIAGHARIDNHGQRLSLEAMVASLDGERVLSAGGERYLKGRKNDDLESARALGTEVARSLIVAGAEILMRQAEATLIQHQKLGN